ncbi:MAG: hypothetical protein WAX89_00640, partial [Alphaproteobacteria bacterium]
MSNIFRQSRHPLIRWWWEMDRVTFVLVLMLMLAGAVAVTTAGVAVIRTYGVGPYYFAMRQYAYLLAA